MNTHHYDKQKYQQAIQQFDAFLQQCTIVSPVEPQIGKLKISTITCVCQISSKISIETLFPRLEPIENNIIYVEYSNCLKGLKKSGAKKNKKKNNQLFSNQMSIGFACVNKTHTHKNPISVKIFRNGRIQMTGCKNVDEIQNVYERLAKLILPLKTFPFHKKNVKIEMINATFYVNQILNLHKVLKLFSTKYSHTVVFPIQNKTSPLNLSIKKYSYMDEKKQKDKIPSVFIYNTGAINIIATKDSILQDTYNFIKVNLETNWDEIVQKQIIFPRHQVKTLR